MNTSAYEYDLDHISEQKTSDHYNSFMRFPSHFEQLMKVRYNIIIYLLSKIIERKSAVEKFIDVLHTQTTWLTSPACTKYYLNREGGLLEHSIGVAETLLQLRGILAPDISEESCVIVGLFPDVGKVGMPGETLLFA